MSIPVSTEVESAPGGEAPEIRSLRQLTPRQWRSGAAAWLGWLFDGLDMHLYTLVALPFVAHLLGGLATTDDRVAACSSWIQAAFLVGWALGGGFFGRIGDRLGRSRTLSLTILTYALFTGLSFFAQTWWQLLIFRFAAALGIGGEWAVGASLLSETWPRSWRPWIAAVLQTAVNVGVLVAALAGLALSEHADRTLFLVGIVPALLVFWIRRQVPETEEWHAAKLAAGKPPSVSALFSPEIRWTAVLTILVCSLSLTAHWAFMFWYSQHLRNLPEVRDWTEPQKRILVSGALCLVMVASIVGNFVAARLARLWGYRWAIALMLAAYFVAMSRTYIQPRDHNQLWIWLALTGVCQGVFALFTMYLPPLFPTLLRTTGAGFCYNIGRLAAAAGTVAFGLSAQVGDFRTVLLNASFLFLPAALVALLLPEPPELYGETASGAARH